MSVQLAYLGVILVWATTPLAIKWSNHEVSYLFGVTARMAIGALLCWVLLLALRIPFPLTRDARRTYGAAVIGIFGAMLMTYWGAQYITSGLVSVIFGVTPLATGIMAAAWLGERSLSPERLGGIVLGFVGLVIVFGGGMQLGDDAWRGITALLIAALLHSASGVLIKRAGAAIHPVALNAGALSIAVVLFALVWLIFDGQIPSHASGRAWGAILYLGIFGSAIGFVLYFYTLKHLSAGVISLITLITPVLALLIGQWFNHEATNAMVWIGTACILAGLLFYQWGGRITVLMRRAAE